MGNEAFCKVRVGKQESEGKALLETSEILFRGDFRLKIPLSTVKSAKAGSGMPGLARRSRERSRFRHLRALCTPLWRSGGVESAP